MDNPAQKLPLKFVDPAVILDESDKWKKLWDEIVLKAATK
jgi:iron(III) transport system substrate-binding protein